MSGDSDDTESPLFRAIGFGMILISGILVVCGLVWSPWSMVVVIAVLVFLVLAALASDDLRKLFSHKNNVG